MESEESEWSYSSSSSSDDGDPDFVDTRKTKQSSKSRKNPMSQRPRRKRESRQSSSSEDDDDDDDNPPPPRKSQKEAKKSTSSSPSTATATATSRLRSIRKRRLSPSPDCLGDLSDSSSSSSDDSLIFRNSYSLTRKKNTKKNTITDNGARKNCSGRESVRNSEYAKTCGSLGVKLSRSDGGKCSVNRASIDNTQLEREIAADWNSSDSDDTAELMRQLTRKKPSTQNKFDSESSSPPKQLPSCSSTSSPKPKESPSRNHKGDAKNKNADDEGSQNGEHDDGDSIGQSLTREDSRIASYSDAKPPPQGIPKEVCSRSNAFALQDNNEQSEPVDDTTKNNPLRFELPPQSSSSEESSDSDSAEDEESCEGSRLHHASSQRKNSVARRRTDDVYLGESLLVESAPLPRYSQQQHHGDRHHHQQQQQQLCIDLVDSDEGEQEMQTSKNGKDENRSQEPRHLRTIQIFENEESPNSPSRRRSPRFNIVSRNFIYNKPWTNCGDGQREEDDDVVQFEDDDSRFSKRPRRVTQDHTNRISNHNNNHGGNLMNRASSASNYFPSQSSNLPSHQYFPPEKQVDHRSMGVGNIQRPWPSDAPQRTCRMRDPTASNVSLASSVVVKTATRGGRTTSKFTAQSASESIGKVATSQERRCNNGGMGDIRTFMSRRPNLANEVRNRARSIEMVRADRHDIQGHSNITVVNQQAERMVTGRKAQSRSQRLQGGEDEDDVIEVFDDEEEDLSPLVRREKAPSKVPKAKAKRKRTATRRTKSRKTSGRKYTRKKAGGRGRGRGRGGGRFGRRGGNSTAGSTNDSGAWGPTGGGWASARPVHKEDPAFKNVGAEITF